MKRTENNMSRKQETPNDPGSLAGGSRREFLKTAAVAAAAPFRPGIVSGAHAQSPTRREAEWSPSRVGSPLPRRRLGSLEVTAVGLGCMNIAWAYAPPTDRKAAIRLIRTVERSDSKSKGLDL